MKTNSTTCLPFHLPPGYQVTSTLDFSCLLHAPLGWLCRRDGSWPKRTVPHGGSGSMHMWSSLVPALLPGPDQELWGI
jgi:hypothetical protein